MVIILPSFYETKRTIYIAEEYERARKDSYSIPANKNKIIKYPLVSNYYRGYYSTITFTSTKKNMHPVLSEENETTDYIILNYYINFPIFVEKSEEAQTIEVKSYITTFSFFGALNPFSFKLLYKYGEKYFEEEYGVNFNNYIKLTQINHRFYSKSFPEFDFYNGYFNNLNIGINIYIKQLYGGSIIYECNADDVDEKDLTFITTPISNKKCKNKKSLLNRLFSLDGTRIISGYITPDSCFDIYAEIDDKENTNIEISHFMTDVLHKNNTAKYLRKNIQYTINFQLDHMVKLDPAFNAEITLTNGDSNIILNSQNLASYVSGKGFTIKSNDDAMVYFFGRYNNMIWAQKEIDIDRSKGKIIKVSNIEDDLLMDIGFEGFYPSTHPLEYPRIKNGVHYFNNIYEKLNEKLAIGEKVYLYHRADYNRNLVIEYIEKNLDNKNNEFNIFLIPGNDTKNALAINTPDLEYLIPDIHFCHIDTTLQLSILNIGENETSLTIRDDNSLSNNLKLFRKVNKIIFQAEHPLVFAYSFYDKVDEKYFRREETLKNNRIPLNDLRIEEIKDKNDKDNIIAIKFKPNYKQSSTRYIIIIAQQNDQNTLDTFKEPCYITGLLNQRPSGVKVDIIYDIGDNDSINAEVDITDILNNSNKYVVNIISQELRFERKINFYQPKEFNHVGKNPNADDDNGLSGSNLALAIVLPIVGVILIGVGVFFFCIRKGSSSSDEIEKLTNREIII